MTETRERGEELRKLRLGGKVSLDEVARRIEGLKLNDLSRLELGYKPVSEEQFADISHAIREIVRERAQAVGAA